MLQYIGKNINEGDFKMLIDFHTHCFPDAVAAKAIPKLSGIGGIKNITNGTVSDNVRKMDECGVDINVVCNIATNPKQMTNVNNFAIELNQTQSRMIALGSVNPDCSEEEIKKELERLKAAGIKGIKIHPDYMETEVDSPKFDPIYKKCCELDMFVITHAGYDFYSPNYLHSTPEMILNVITKFPCLKIVAAHLGGFKCWDRVLKLLCGKNIWLDTSLICAPDADIELGRRVICEHNPDRLLFGSDTPWYGADSEKELLLSLDLDNELKEKIWHINAEKLLGI